MGTRAPSGAAFGECGPTMSLLDLAILGLFPVLMAYAAWSDLFTMTISNLVSILLVAIFLLLAFAAGVPLGTVLATHVAAGAAVLVLTFLFFARGWIGGGDAKLAAATAVWLGWDNLFEYGLEASVLGAALTLGLLYFRKMPLPDILIARRWITRLHERGTGVPYGIALAVAGLSLYPDTALWHAVLGR
jgi:prepilin peptidase CpaA